jgi:CRISPR-associated endonuclease Cas2
MLVLFSRSSEYYSMKQQTGGVKDSAAAIIKILGAGALVAGSLAVPNLASALAPLIQKQSGLDESDIHAGLRYLLKQGWATYREVNNQTEVYLTKSGRSRWQKIELDKPLASDYWDGIWRLVIFDIPTKRRLRRDALRNQLKRVGFRQLQESVWITPYDCVDFLDTIRSVYKLRDQEVKLVEATSFEGQLAYMQLFGLERR